MRRPTFQVLSAAFTLAIAACKKEPLTEKPPPVPEPPTATTATTTATAPAPMRYGQRCAGSVVANLHPKEAVDYLELRLDYYPENKREIVTAGTQGEACKSAKDLAACKTTLAQAKAAKGGEYLVYTRGPNVETVNGKATGAFLAPIDSAEEAAVTLVFALAEDTSAAAVLPSCDPKEFKATNDGWETTHTITSFCEEKTVTTYAVSKSGEVKTLKTTHTAPTPGCHPPTRGRRPEGFALAGRDDASSLGGHFAEAAEMEAASVFAFERLDAELARLGAPSALRRRAKRAAEDEVRHAEAMAVLAHRFGAADPRAVEVDAPPDRTVLDMAIENAVEGCVFETWAALLAEWQSQHAADEEVRASMKRIARDETRHAALAWDVASFLSRRLTAAERALVTTARKNAVAQLEAQLQTTAPASDLRETTGLPSEEEALALARACFDQLETACTAV